MTKSADMATLLDSNSKVPGADIAGTSLPVASINATGTPSASTFLRGDGSWQAPAGGVTSLAAGNGITVSASTGAVTVSQDIYTGSTANNTSFPIGTVLSVQRTGTAVNGTTVTIYVANSVPSGYDFSSGGGKSALSGTWRARGQNASSAGCNEYYYLYQRTA